MCKIKKMLSVALALIMTFSMFAGIGLTANAGNDADLFKYEIKNQSVTITGYNDLCVGDIIIPDTIEGYPVTKIGDDAFANCDSITSITFPESVTTIGKNAFSRTRNLKNVYLPNNLTSIEEMAFFSSSIESVVVPGTVTNLEHHAFSCAGIKTMIISEGVTEIPARFVDLGSLRNIVIPTSVKKIDESAFATDMHFTDIYYAGTEEDWNKIEFVQFGMNDVFENVTIHYSSYNEIVIQPKDDTISISSVKNNADFKKAVNNSKYVLADAYGKELAANAVVGTGCIVKIYNSDSIITDMKQLVVKYDVNGDGYITADDARLALRASAQLENVAGVYAIAANVNGDDQITAEDARLILRRSAGLE